MSYHFSKYVLLRIPVFAEDHYERSLSGALKDPLFQAAIYLASPQFYERLYNASFDPMQMNPRELQTVNRYYNRACYRATPFGYFASVSMGMWEQSGHIYLEEATSELEPFIHPAEWLSQKLKHQINTSEPGNLKFEPNPTLYRIKKQFRFIREESVDFKSRVYQLQSSQYSLVLRDLLRFSKHGQTRERLIAHICKDANCTPEEGRAYFEFLKDAQILLIQNRPTIAGFDIKGNEHDSGSRPQPENLSPVKNKMLLNVTGLQALHHHWRTSVKHSNEQHELNVFNAVLVRQLAQNTIDARFQQQIIDGISALNKLCPPDQLPALTHFINLFNKHFEGERVPLLIVLDPEVGVGYQNEPFESPNPLLETINIRHQRKSTDIQSWSAAHQYLMGAWLKMEKEQRKTISIIKDDLLQIPGSDDLLIPLGSNLLFNVIGESVHIESAGGANPAALIGRFTLANEVIFGAAKSMARDIEALNPDLIFAELLHLTDPHADNVNRRAQIWSYQLPLLAGHQADKEVLQLRLDDLWIEIVEGKVWLWSKKYQKYVIPRLTSAYNHGIDQLPLFRFLSDLSYQYGRTQLSFDLMRYFPGFTYYPRVEYQQAILSLATWIFQADDLLQVLDREEPIKAFGLFAQKHALPDRFVIIEGDQQLVFDQNKPSDLTLFRETIRQKKQVIIKELLSAQANNPVVKSRTGAQYLVQYNSFLLPDAPLSLPKHAGKVIQHEQRKFIPGTEWLYLKLYVPRLSVNRLLLQLQPMLSKRFVHGKISRWFFIRYEDHAPHIRLRLKINPADIDAILASLRLILEDNVQQHLIREYQLDVYSRELERYEAVGIEDTEAFFWYSSNFVVQYLKAAKSGMGVPAFLAATFSVKLITEGFYANQEEQLAFWEQSFESYYSEFKGKRLKIELDQKYREIRHSLDQFLNQENAFKEKKLSASLYKIKLKAKELGSRAIAPQSKAAYLLSLIHMHLNRLFVDQQRQQEMITFFLLGKWMRSQLARKKPIKPNVPF